MLKRLSIIIAVSLVFSCAPKKEVIKEEVITPEKLILPELIVKPEPPKEKKVEPVRIEEEKEGKYIILNFDGADIETVIASFGELLEMNYILTPGITGKVTIQSYKKFPLKDLSRIFQTILEINGLTAVKDGAFYRIVPIDTAKMQPLEVEKGKEVVKKLDEGFITQLIPLGYVKAGEAANILRNLAPRGTDIIVYEPANLLIVTALPHTLVKFMKIIEAVDISDVEGESVKTFVYYVENGEAKKLADILKTLYEGKKGVIMPTPVPQTPRPGTIAPASVTQITEGLPGAIGDITITAYEDINALIVQCTPRSYLALLEILKRIDISVKQVLIEVMIAEVSLSDETKFGLEWLLTTKSGDKVGFNIGAATSTPTDRFAAVVSGSIDTTVFNYVLGALSTTSKFNVIASPHILTVDNKEAKIQIGDEIPIATGTSTVTGGQTTTVQYKTIGTILTVKPHITEKDRVTLDVTQEISQLGDLVPIAGVNYQGIKTTTAKTTAVVQSGHTLLLGGLIRELKQQGRSGIPWLSKIPILGYLFSTTTDTSRKTELLLLVTPYVISNQEEADSLTKEFQSKIKTIQKKLEEDD
ncbi:MAG: hypothetical protein HY805_05630 [Nitrospirae bacterium]|nr:hypothetical protein [Nitrospirota bacterium]